MKKLLFISHRHSDREIASLLVDFLLAALDLEDSEIRCTSVPGHTLPFGNSISELLKKDLNCTAAVIALITTDSLKSTWVLFELGSSWAMGKLLIPILGPGVKYNELPGPLKNYHVVQIEEKNASYLLREAINQIANNLEVTQKRATGRTDAKRDEFVDKLLAWQPQHNDDKSVSPDQLKSIETSYKNKIQQLTEQLKQKELSATQELNELKDELKKQEKSNYDLRQERDSYNSQIKQLKEQIKQLESPTKVVEIKIELRSERGVDYTGLRALLEAQNWKEADRETANVMLQAAERTSQGYLTESDIESFPCEDLRTINQLWLKYSDGKFGFSVQKEIYQSLGGTKEYNQEIWSSFGDRVGWKKGDEWLDRDAITWNLSAQEGHLPYINGWVDMFAYKAAKGGGVQAAFERMEAKVLAMEWVEDAGGVSSLAQRLVTCNL
ncbi:MAG: GUN4 domain-containing protein [Prochloraceae cyanobacterium]|nr:GUN4 domain-containing protein [Prochloraceae cyanobacterium]